MWRLSGAIRMVRSITVPSGIRARKRWSPGARRIPLIGVSPISSPSISMIAHGVALMETEIGSGARA
jgi:hypothetical protein